MKNTISFENRYRYTSREYVNDELYYYRARYMRPDLGRFVAMDPLGMVDGSNRIIYVANWPIMFTDPFGLKGGPGNRPDSCSCDRSQIKNALKSVLRNLELMSRGKEPYGSSIGGSNMQQNMPGEDGWQYPVSGDPSTFDPACTASDPCVFHCCEQHEWFHFNDRRPWNIYWSTERINIFWEQPAYEVEKKCLESFL